MINAKMPKRLSAWLVVLAAGVVAVLATGMISTSKSKNDLHLRTTKYAVSRRLTEIFKVFDHGAQAHSASVTVPAELVQTMTATHPGLDFSDAVATGGTAPTWVIPGTTEVCLIHEFGTPGNGYGGGVCGTIAAAEHGLAVGTENANHEPLVIGLVPNGNKAVTVTESDDTEKSVPVTNNMYEVTGGHPSSVHVKEASGKSSTRVLPVPPGAK